VIWPLDSNDLEREDRAWATKEESPPRLVAGGRPGVACSARASKVARPEGLSKLPSPSVAERGAVPGVLLNNESAKRTKEESCQRVNADSSQGTDSYPAPASLMRVVRHVQRTRPNESKNS
jgi:hypothetical protein